MNVNWNAQNAKTKPEFLENFREGKIRYLANYHLSRYCCMYKYIGIDRCLEFALGKMVRWSDGRRERSRPCQGMDEAIHATLPVVAIASRIGGDYGKPSIRDIREAASCDDGAISAK